MAGDDEVTATLEYGPIEFSDTGEYLGYMPLSVHGEAAVNHDHLLKQAATALDLRFEQWKVLK